MARKPRPARLMPVPDTLGPQSADDQNSFAISAVISGAPQTDAAISALLSDQPGLFVNNLTNATHK